MDASNNASPLRLVARIGPGAGWFPEGISEVVGRTDGRFLSLMLTRVVGTRGIAELHDFDCANREACLRAVRAWLHAMALHGGGVPSEPQVARWADDTARRMIAALPSPER